MSKNKSSTVYLLLGTNLGDKLDNLKNASQLLSQSIGEIVLTSPVFETEPWGNPDQPNFYNQALKISTTVGPMQLMTPILLIEQQLGRKRDQPQHWGPRTIDIDILYYDDISLTLHNITIPHPQIPQRKFVLETICSICPDLLHPDLALTQRQLLDQCEDTLSVKKI